jgi:nucleoside-diphosphate-sugar epimerase
VKIFVTVATGYIGGARAQRLVEEGHQVHGLVRSPEEGEIARANRRRACHRRTGRRRNSSKGRERSRRCHYAASSDHRAAVETLLDALTGSEKPLIHTSGSSIVSDDARGDFESPKIYHDNSYIQPLPIRQARVAIDRVVRIAGISLGIRAVVICPTTAIAELGESVRSSLASNSRVRATNARRLLGWSPKGPSLLEVLEKGT